MERIWYLCDGEKPDCKKTHCFKNEEDGCRHTSDVKHARNFRRRRNNNFWEGMKCDDEACAARKNTDDAQHVLD